MPQIAPRLEARAQGLLVERLTVYPERMLANLALTRGLVFSQAVLLALTEAGLSREEAYEIVQQNAMRTWAGEGDFRELLAQDGRVSRTLSAERLGACFEPRRYLRHVDAIYRRVFEGRL